MGKIHKILTSNNISKYNFNIIDGRIIFTDNNVASVAKSILRQHRIFIKVLYSLANSYEIKQ